MRRKRYTVFLKDHRHNTFESVLARDLTEARTAYANKHSFALHQVCGFCPAEQNPKPRKDWYLLNSADTAVIRNALERERDKHRELLAKCVTVAGTEHHTSLLKAHEDALRVMNLVGSGPAYIKIAPGY